MARFISSVKKTAFLPQTSKATSGAALSSNGGKHATRSSTQPGGLADKLSDGAWR
jgi:hypothetical protein